MYTSVAILAFANILAAAPEPRPIWMHDYWQGQKKGTREQKPLAVFIGTGQADYQKLTRQRKHIQKILAEKYVCVYLDTTKNGASSLARSLDISRGQGLVISDRSGTLQAFRHDGSLSETDLHRQLARFADPNLVVRTTETNSRISFYPTERPYTPAPVGRSC